MNSNLKLKKLHINLKKVNHLFGAKPKKKNYRKKVETSWSHESILKLIKEVELQRSLWDVGCAEYKMHKDFVWQQVADAIPASFNDCKGKWANLRTSFNYNLHKYRKTKSGHGTVESVPVTWKYFKPMMFLENNKLRQSTHSPLSMQPECVTTDESIFKDLGLRGELSSLSPSLPEKQRKRKSSTSTSLPLSSRRNNNLKEMAVQALHSMKCRQPQPKDSFTAFGEYIASELRSLTSEQALHAKSKLRRAFNDIMDEVLFMIPQ